MIAARQKLPRGRAATAWAAQLAAGTGFDPQGRAHVEVARILDCIYGDRAPGGAGHFARERPENAPDTSSDNDNATVLE